ncbi:MAG: hypothetical protein WC239_02285 [Sphaerochaetaceae bacterium]
MQLEFEFNEELTHGTMPSVYNLPDAVLMTYVRPGDTKMYYLTAPNPDSDSAINWKDDVRLYLLDDTPRILALDQNVEWPCVYYIPGVRTYLTWYSEDRHRIAMLPDDDPLYPPESPYRLYYAVDTEILYMNIAEYWQMIGTPHHNLLYDLAEGNPHPQYLLRLYGDQLPEPSTALRGQVFTLRKGDGEADEPYICVKDDNDVYVWVPLPLNQ